MQHILLTNDDGIFAPGLLALARALEQTARLTIVAPSQECSASSNALTIRTPLRLERVTLNGSLAGWSCSGTPVDSVKMGIRVVCRDDRPDLVISGINPGSNLGSDVLYSGTVGAAMDGVLFGIPSFAISLCYGDSGDFSVAGAFARTLAKKVLADGLPPGVLLNVNMPPGARPDCSDVRITTQGRGRFLEDFEQRTDPNGRPYYWIQGLRHTQPDSADSDESAVAANAVSITPLRVDLTDRTCMESLKRWNLKI